MLPYILTKSSFSAKVRYLSLDAATRKMIPDRAAFSVAKYFNISTVHLLPVVFHATLSNSTVVS